MLCCALVGRSCGGYCRKRNRSFRSARGDAFRRGPLDVPRKARGLERGDEPIGDVDPVPGEPERGRIRERMMIVVPALAPGEPAQQPVVAAGVVRTLAPAGWLGREWLGDPVWRPARRGADGD